MKIKSASIVKYSLNLGIRGATIGFKFLFALFLGKFFPEEVLGTYGLFSTTILVSYLLLSLSFEAYALREILAKPKENQLTLIRNEAVYFLLAFAVYTTIGILFFNRGLISNELIIYFVIILLLETITQVCFSVFTILNKPTAANLIMFVSQGSWIAVALVVWYINPSTITEITDILKIWIIGGIAACLFGVTRIIAHYGSMKVDPIDWRWIRTGIRVSLLFFCALLGYKVIEYADRYFIEFMLDTSQLGVYIFFSQMANIINAVINVTVILMLYPRLIENYNQRDFVAYKVIKRKMYIRVLVISVGVGLGAFVFLKFALVYIGKESFSNHMEIFYILLVSNLAMNLSFITHYCMYAMRKDVALVITTVLAAAACLLLNYLLVPYYGIAGAATATCSSFSIAWVLKALYVWQAEKKLGIRNPSGAPTSVFP